MIETPRQGIVWSALIKSRALIYLEHRISSAVVRISVSLFNLFHFCHSGTIIRAPTAASNTSPTKVAADALSHLNDDRAATQQGSTLEQT